MTPIFKANGVYLGFIQNNFLFSRDGLPLGWIEGNFAWDTSGKFRGVLSEHAGHSYILLNKLAIPPLPKSPKVLPANVILPSPEPNIIARMLPLGWVDAF